jgi:hypothetical protein
MQPCRCGACIPPEIPAEWMAYMLWINYSRAEFEELDRAYR